MVAGADVHLLTVVGMFVEGVGLAITMVGLFVTWRAYSEPEASLWSPVTGWFGARGNSLRRIIQAAWFRLRPGSRDVVVGVGTAELHFRMGKARGRVTWGPLPTGKTTERIHELDRRVQAISNQIADLAERHDDALEAVGREVGRIEVEMKQMAVGDIRLQFVGVVVLVIGLALQLAGSLL